MDLLLINGNKRCAGGFLLSAVLLLLMQGVAGCKKVLAKCQRKRAVIPEGYSDSAKIIRRFFQEPFRSAVQRQGFAFHKFLDSKLIVRALGDVATSSVGEGNGLPSARAVQDARQSCLRCPHSGKPEA